MDFEIDRQGGTVETNGEILGNFRVQGDPRYEFGSGCEYCEPAGLLGFREYPTEFRW